MKLAIETASLIQYQNQSIYTKRSQEDIDNVHEY